MKVMRIDWTKIRVKMAERNVRSVARLSAGAGVHQNTVYNDGPFTSATLDRIADFLDCDPREFIALVDEESEPPPPAPPPPATRSLRDRQRAALTPPTADAAKDQAALDYAAGLRAAALERARRE